MSTPDHSFRIGNCVFGDVYDQSVLGLQWQCDHKIVARTPDIVVVGKEDRVCKIIDVAEPADCSVNSWESGKIEKCQDCWSFRIRSTPALRTPRYYGHPAITDSSKIPGESYRRLTEINSRYYGLSLLRTYGHFIRSQRHNFIVFSLVIADTEQHLGIFAHISSLFFLLFETVFVFFGRFPLLLSISQNSPIFFS